MGRRWHGAGGKTLAAGQQSDHLLDAAAVQEWLRLRGGAGRRAAAAFALAKCAPPRPHGCVALAHPEQAQAVRAELVEDWSADS